MLYYIYYVFSGAAAGMLYLSALVANQQTFSNNVTFAHIVASLGFTGGPMVAGLIVPVILAEFGWRGLMAIEAALMLHALPLSCFFIVKRTQLISRINANDASSKDFRILLRNIADNLSFFCNGKFLIYCMARIGAQFSFVGLVSHTPGRAVFIGLTLSEGSLFLSLMSFGAFVSRLVLTGILYKWASINNVLIAALSAALSALILLVITFTTSFISLAALYALYGCFHGWYSHNFLPYLLFNL